MVFPYCFSSPRVLAAEAITSLQVELVLRGLVDHKLNLQPIVLFFALREWLFGKADLEHKGVFLKVSIDS